MATTLFEMYASLGLDTSQFEQALSTASADARRQWQQVSDYLARQQQGDQQNTSRFSRFMQQQGQSIKDAMSNMFSISAGNLLTQAINGVTSAVKELASESIEAASSLNEVQNVVDVTFGDSANTINTWAKSAISSYGLSETKAKQYTGTLGALLKSMNVADDAVVSMSTDMAGLAADMASFYNLDYDTAFEKIRSGISGETEPLKALGINMSVANLNAYALAKGIDKTYDSMTSAEQATLRYQYLMSATADAQGDFARTNEDYANATRLLEQNMQSLKTTIGQSLLEMVTPIINDINGLFAQDTVSTIVSKITMAQDEENDATAEAQTQLAQATTLITKLQEMEEEQGDAAHETDEWAATLASLSNVMPDLAKDIDLSTNSLKVNTDKLLENAKAAEQAAIYNARLATVNESKDIVTEAEEGVTTAMKNKFTAEAEQSYWKSILDPFINEVAEQTGDSYAVVLSTLNRANNGVADMYGDARGYFTDLGYSLDDLLYYKAVAGSAESARLSVVEAEETIKQAEEDLAYAQQINQQATENMQAWVDGDGSAAEAQANYNKAVNKELDLITQVESA